MPLKSWVYQIKNLTHIDIILMKIAKCTTKLINIYQKLKYFNSYKDETSYKQVVPELKLVSRNGGFTEMLSAIFL